MAEAKMIRLQTDMPHSISILGIPDHLIRLVLNLLDNAIKYTPQGGQVRLSAAYTLTEVCIKIQDNGSGIAVEHLPHLFERFYRIERERSSAIGGAGLGLSIAYQIAREHHGRIEVDSVPDSGATFRIYLPTTSSSEY
jgi:signal transduction histidine kinase